MIFSYKSNIDTSQLKQEKDFCTSRKAKHLPMLFYQVFLNRISIQKQTFSLQWCEMPQNVLQYGKTLYATPASHIIQSNTIKPKQKTHFILSISYFVTMALDICQVDLAQIIHTGLQESDLAVGFCQCLRI